MRLPRLARGSGKGPELATRSVSWYGPRRSSDDDSYDEPSAYTIRFDPNTPGEVVNVGKYVDIAIHDAWEMACIDRISKDTSQVQFTILRDGKVAPTRDRWARRLASPNEVMDTVALFEATAFWLELCGNAFWMLSTPPGGDPLAGSDVPDIEVPCPSDVMIVGSRTKRVDHYELLVRDKMRQVVKTIKFGTDEVVHFRYINPLSDIWGMPPQEALHDVLQTDRQAQEYNKNILQSGLSVPGVLVVEEALSESDRRRLRRELEERHGGYKNAFVPMILEGMKWQQTAVNPKDFEFAAGREDNREAILGVHGVPPSVLGLTKDTNYATYQLEIKSYWLQTIPTRVGRIVGTMNAWFANHDPRYGLSASYAAIPILQEDPKQKSLRMVQEVAGGLATQNEARLLLGRPARSEPWADVLYPPQGQAAQGEVGRPKGDDTPDTEKPDTSGDYDSQKAADVIPLHSSPLATLRRLASKGNLNG